MTRISLTSASIALVLLMVPSETFGFNTGHSFDNVRLQTNRWVQSRQQFTSTSTSLKYQEGSYDLEFKLSSPFTSREKLCTHQNSSANNRYAAGDWLHNVRTLPRSSVLREIRNPVITVAIWSQLVAITYRLMQKSGSEFFQKISSNMCIGALPHSLLVSSLGLLLVFRTNSAYQRFAEGRKIWEQIHSVSRNMSRFMTIYEEEIGTEKKHRVKNLLAAFPYLLRHHIRPRCLDTNGSSIDDENTIELEVHPNTVVDTRYEGDQLTMTKEKETHKCLVDRRGLPWNLFSKDTLKKVVKVENRPLWVCDHMAKELATVPYGPNFTSRERLTLVGQIEKLSNAVGECERIHQTAVPLNYARHSLRSLTIWLFSLPFVMIKDIGLLTGPVMAVISWLLFGVYQIGYTIEDPFQGTLRLSIMCDAIKKDVLGDEIVEDLASETDEALSQHVGNETNNSIDEQFRKIATDFAFTKELSETVLSRKKQAIVRY